MSKKRNAEVPAGSSRTPFLSVTLKDCDVQHFAAGGPGGQHQNTSNTGARVIHRPSGARGESREHRSQLQNTKAAFRRMAESPQFAIWVNRMLWKDPLPPEEQVARDMNPANLLVMSRDDGRWTIID